jgi:ubiquinol-cytochrome c reductase cytochrome b subunit
MSFYLAAIRNPLLSTISNHIDGYPTPINLSYLWGFGSIAGMALVTQIVTGVLLAMHYAPEIHLAFTSVEHIMRDVRGGTILRYIHANGASMFFIVVYLHMFRGLYYGSYFQPRANLWYSGILIFFLMMATGFLGYVLPWGQMSFWGATVITNLFSAIPGIGNSIVQLLWGGFSVDNPTLNRFFSLHYLLPFLIVAVVFLHLILLHQQGSNNPLGISSIFDRIPFYPYFYVKDLFGFLLFVLFFSFFVIYAPNFLGHPDNYIEANPLVTPAHIVPEWYFLPFYAILRTIPDKLGGVVLMGLAIVIIAILPVVDTSTFRSSFFKPLNLWLFWYFFADSLSLGWIGQEIVESPFIEMANFVTLSYFLYFLPLLPLLGFLENSSILWGVRYYNANLKTKTVQIYDINLNKYNYMSILIGPSFFENIISNQNWLINFVSSIQLFHFFLITLSLLFVASNLPRRVNSLEFLHRLGFGYFFINFLLSTIDRPIRNNFMGSNFIDIVNTLSSVQQDSALFHLFFLFVSVMLLSFFYGTIDKFLLQNGEEIEFPILIVFISSSALILFYVHTLIEFLMALETLTLASYVCAGYERQNRHSSYAGVQYFILGSIPSGMLILGMGLLYSQSGVLNFEDLDLICYNNSSYNLNNFSALMYEEFNMPASSSYKNLPTFGYFNALSNNSIFLQNVDNLNNSLILTTEELITTRTPAFLGGILFILFNLLFKLTAAPFHFWAVSIYKYAPIPTVTYISVISKAMVVFLLFKFSLIMFQPFNLLLTPLFLSVAVLTVFIGLIGALAEKFVKPFFVYSSMGHVGFMLAGLSLFSLTGFSATFHYLGVYILSSFLMWFILLYSGKDTKYLISFKLLKKGDPIVALIFAFLIFSMSGIPPLGGFFIKLDVLAALLENSHYGVNILLFFFTVATFFYYLKLNKILFFDQSTNFIKTYELNSNRLQLFILLFFFLIFYMFLVQSSLYEIGRDFFLESL